MKANVKGKYTHEVGIVARGQPPPNPMKVFVSDLSNGVCNSTRIMSKVGACGNPR